MVKLFWLKHLRSLAVIAPLILGLISRGSDGIWVNHDFAAIENALDEDNFFYPEDSVEGYDDNTFPLLMPKVKPPNPESYLCTPVKIQDETFFINGFSPKAIKHTAHHMLLYGCEKPGTMEDLWNCGEMNSSPEDPLEHHQPCKKGSQILYGWAMDAPDLTLPEGVGFRVGEDTRIKYLVLQVHYNELDMIPAEGDNSGILLHYTRTPLPKTAGVLLLGTGGFAPAHTTTFFETACMMDDEREIHPFYFRTHTHKLGKVVSGWRVTQEGRENKWDLIGKKSPQDPQLFYPVHDESITLKKNDIVAARCTMVNDRDTTTWIGPTNMDEMCNFYIMYWVEGKKTVHPDVCFTAGPPDWSWARNASLKNIPNDEASTL